MQLATTKLSPLHLVAVVALLTALGCGGDDGSDPGNDGGNDDDGAVTEGCSAGCNAGQRCEDEVCVSVDWLYVSLGETAFAAPRPSTQRAQVLSYAGVRDAAVDQRPLLAESGDCTVHGAGDYLGTHEVACGDWGSIGVTGVAPLDYDCTDGVANVFTESEGLLEPGSTVTVTGAGGAVFPAFSVDVELPASVTGSFSAIEQGASIEATWNAAGATAVNVLVTVIDDEGAATTVMCRTDDTGSLVIDAALTDLFPATITTWFASITRWDNTHLEPEGAGVAIDVGSYADLRVQSL